MSAVNAVPEDKGAPARGEHRILIIAELSIPPCKRYRVDQKVEALHRLGCEVSVENWWHIERCRTAMRDCSLVIFYRVGAYADVVGLINQARDRGIPTLFDVDDLIFDRDVYQANRDFQRRPPEERNHLLDGVDHYRRSLWLCDHAIASTNALARAMWDVTPGFIFVVENGLDGATLELAESILSDAGEASGDEITIGYGSGTQTHNADFAMVGPVLLELLSRHPRLHLSLHGYLDLPTTYEAFSERIHRFPFVDAESYLRAIADWDIAISPLEDSVFNNAKSTIKYIEAAVVEMPMVCSGTPPFRELVAHGHDGFLADSLNDWETALQRLIESDLLRSAVGRNARETALRRYHPSVIAERQVRPLLDLLSGKPDVQVLRNSPELPNIP
jgi:hypothetical protein